MEDELEQLEGTIPTQPEEELDNVQDTSQDTDESTQEENQEKGLLEEAERKKSADFVALRKRMARIEKENEEYRRKLLGDNDNKEAPDEQQIYAKRVQHFDTLYSVYEMETEGFKEEYEAYVRDLIKKKYSALTAEFDDLSIKEKTKYKTMAENMVVNTLLDVSDRVLDENGLQYDKLMPYLHDKARKYLAKKNGGEVRAAPVSGKLENLAVNRLKSANIPKSPSNDKGRLASPLESIFDD